MLADIPPLAFAAAQEAGLPSVALGNFSWDWIYRELAARPRGDDGRRGSPRGAVVRARPALLLQLPFAGDLRGPSACASAFRWLRVVRVVARAKARQAFGAEGRPTRRAVLVRRFRITRQVARKAGISEDSTRGRRCAAGSSGHWTRLDVTRERLGSLGLVYPDLVGAADVVVTKPGYGIVTDWNSAGTRLVYTDRGDFPEYPVMVAEMPRYLPAVFSSKRTCGRAGWVPRSRRPSRCRGRRVPGSTAPPSRRRGSSPRCNALVEPRPLLFGTCGRAQESAAERQRAASAGGFTPPK